MPELLPALDFAFRFVDGGEIGVLLFARAGFMASRTTSDEAKDGAGRGPSAGGSTTAGF